MNKKFSFRVTGRDSMTHARTGVLTTRFGTLETPAFVPVGTGATVKTLTPEEIKSCKIDLFFVNTYHMVFHPGIETVRKIGGLHTFMNWNGSVMTDSGGFQAFSLSEHGPRKHNSRASHNTIPTAESLVKISDEGITFTSAWSGSKVFLGPKESIRAQQDLDSDIMMAFDECTFYPITKKRAQKAMQRTHLWLDLCLQQKKEKPEHALYGIVQGSVFEDLRQESARYVSGRPVDGFAIGSVANSREPREKVFAVLDWSLPILLPYEKPIHFLGIGEIEDILISVSKGIDTLDCVTPTRMGRMGFIFTREAGLSNKFRYDITKSTFSLDKNPPEKNCGCYTCKNFTRAYLHHLFRSKELLSYRLATIHNLYFFGSLMEKVRESIAEKSYGKLKNEWLGN